MQGLHLEILFASLLFAVVRADVESSPIKYGEKIFLQNMRNNNRWLTGYRYSRRDALTMNKFWDSEVSLLKYYEIYIRSDLSTPLLQDDKKNGECVKYGDKVHLGFDFEENGVFLRGPLHVQGTNLAHVLGTSRKVVNVSSFKTGTNTPSFFTWELRSTPGLGRIDGSDPDPNSGRCIDDLSAIYIQNQAYQLKWLAGDIHYEKPPSGDPEYVWVHQPNQPGYKNIFKYQVEALNAKTNTKNFSKYKWIMRRELGDGTTGDALQCAAYDVVGKWMRLHTIEDYNGDAEHTVEYSQGIERTETEGWSKTSSWELSVTSKISAEFKGVGSEMSLTASYGEEMTRSAETSMSISKEQVFSATFGPGTVWQWVSEVSDICQATPWLLKTNDLTLTRSVAEPPCCYPGLAAGNPHGPCLLNTTCFCSKAVCEATPPPAGDYGPERIGGSEFSIESVKGQPFICFIFADFCKGHDGGVCDFVDYWCS